MASKQSKTRPHVVLMASASHAADAASWYCAFVLVALILLSTFRDTTQVFEAVKGTQLLERPCDEIYVVGEGETLHTISDKCGDPFIVEQNPHIHDPDDVFPGLVIRITPSKPRKFLSFLPKLEDRKKVPPPPPSTTTTCLSLLIGQTETRDSDGSSEMDKI